MLLLPLFHNGIHAILEGESSCLSQATQSSFLCTHLHVLIKNLCECDENYPLYVLAYCVKHSFYFCEGLTSYS